MVTVTAVLSPPQPYLDVLVSYETSDGSAVAGEDYTAVSGILTFTAGSTQVNFAVPILNDALVEPVEIFTLELSNSVHAWLGAIPTSTVTIVDEDEYPELNFSASDYVVQEDVGQATVTVTLSQIYPEPVTVAYETSDGTALAGEDYGSITGILTLLPGITSTTFAMSITDDLLVEADEAFSVQLANFTNATAGSPITAEVTILDNDKEPPVSGTSIYLPLIMRPAPPPPPVEFRIHIGDEIPVRLATAQGETFYTMAVQIPATLPTGGAFYLSTDPNQVTMTAIDDQIVFSLPNGDVVFTYRYSDHGEPIQSHIVPVPRYLVEAMAGQRVEVRYSDVFGSFVSATTVWLIWTPING
jgi:hypothetical protein